MENMLIILVFVASIVYKIYSNYKAETEKSAKRNPQRPTSPQRAENSSPFTKPYQAPTPPPIPRVSSQKMLNPFVTKNNTVQDIPEEVQRAKQNRKVRPVEIQRDLNSKKQLDNQPISFDLREAVIQAAILERPYK